MSKASLLAELIRRGFPEGTAAKIVSGDLLMDQASRMKRAAEQGFDTSKTMYHGTDSPVNFTEFSKRPNARGVEGWFTDDPSHASEYANYEEGRDRVIPTYLKSGKIARRINMIEEARKQGIDTDSDAFSEWIADNYDATDHSSGGIKVLIPTKPENIRSKYAAFDPDNAGKNTLLGGLAAGAVLGGEKAEAKSQGEIKAPKNPKTLALANGIRALEGKLKGHPASILVPSGSADWLYKMAYDQKPNNEDRLKVLMDFLP